VLLDDVELDVEEEPAEEAAVVVVVVVDAVSDVDDPVEDDVAAVVDVVGLDAPEVVVVEPACDVVVAAAPGICWATATPTAAVPPAARRATTRDVWRTRRRAASLADASWARCWDMVVGSGGSCLRLIQRRHAWSRPRAG
jgi:hypothetical protein